MSFFQSIEFAQALALLTAGLLFGVPLGWLLHQRHLRCEHRRAMRRKPSMVRPEWTGFDRRDKWETITCDRRQQILQGMEKPAVRL